MGVDGNPVDTRLPLALAFRMQDTRIQTLSGEGMIKSIGILAAGVALGAGAVLLVQLVLYDNPAPAPQPLVTAPQVQAAADPSTSETVSLAQIQDIPEGFERDAALYDLLRGAGANRMEVLLEEAADPDLGWAKRTIYQRYVELSPRATLDYLLSRGTNAQPWITWAVLSWARRDLDAAVAFADTLAEPMRTEAATSLLNGIRELSDARRDEIAGRFSLESELSRTRAIAEAATNPASAWQTALSTKPGQSRTQTLHRISQRWFSQDPAAALSALDAVSDPGQRETWQRQLLARWAGIDREAALQWTVSRPPSTERTSLIAEVAATAAKDSPAEMLAFAETLDAKARREVARRVLAVWARSEPRAALAAVEETDDRRLKQMTEQSLVDTWAQSDPMAVFEWARTRPASVRRTRALSTALRHVARSDPDEALALAEDLDEAARPNAIDSVLRQWGRDDPRAAAAWLDAAQYESHGTVAAIIGEYARLDAEEAVDWLLSQPAEAQRHGASAVIWSLAEESPEVALELVERLEDPTTSMIVGSQLMSRWAADDPRAAVRAIARISRPALYASAFATWSSYDPEGANAFIGQIPASGRDAAIHGVMQQVLSDGDFESAERLFDRIVNAEARRNAATTMYFHLSQTDPEQAERYREMSDVTVDEDGSMIFQIPAQSF